MPSGGGVKIWGDGSQWLVAEVCMSNMAALPEWVYEEQWDWTNFRCKLCEEADHVAAWQAPMHAMMVAAAMHRAMQFL